MNNLKKYCLAFVVGGLCVLNTACDDKKVSNNKVVQQDDPEQQEIIKYNKYVNASNSYTINVADELDKYIDNIQTYKKDGDFQYYSSISGSSLKSLAERLDKAYSLPPKMDDLDTPAKKFSNAINAALPLLTELNDYQTAKTALVDKGKKVRDTEKEYVSLMKNVAESQEQFSDAMEKQDEANMRSLFDKAPKNSPEYYRGGIALYAKQAIREANTVFDLYREGKPSKEINNNFTQSLNKLAEMATGCQPSKDTVNNFVGSGRGLLSKAENGYLSPNSVSGSSPLMAQNLRNSVNNDYMQVINRINMYGCTFK